MLVVNLLKYADLAGKRFYNGIDDFFGLTFLDGEIFLEKVKKMNWLYEDKDLIGSKVISITDATTKDKIIIGEIVRWENFKNGQKMPVVKFEDGTENVCYSLLMPYSDEFFNMLKGCDPTKVWNLCADISLTLQVLHRKGKTKKLEE